MYPSNGICVKNVFIIQHFYLNCSTLFCSEFLSWRKEIQWWCLSLEAYVTESSEFQSFIQAVDSTGHVCSSVSFSLWERRMMRTRLLVQGEIAFFPFSQLVSSVAQWCPTLSDPMDCSLPGSSVHGIFQARVLEWGAIAFSKKVTKYI